MKRALPLLLVAGALAGCGSAGASVNASIAQRKQAAAAEAERLLRHIPLPAGAVQTTQPSGYGGPLLGPGASPAAEDVHRFGFWSYHGSFEAAVAFVRAHPPDGLHSSGVGAYGAHAPQNQELDFSGSRTRFVTVAVVKLPRRIVIRVDTHVVWIYPRSAAEKVPSSVRKIEVDEPKVALTVSDPAKVAKLVRWFDALPISPPGIVTMCAPSGSVRVNFTFRSANGTRLAQAAVPDHGASICDWITFDIGGKQQPPLVDFSDGPTFVERVQRLLGVRLIASRR